MIQSKKLFVIFAGIASLTLGAAVVFSAGEKNVDALRSNATIINNSITFTKNSSFSCSSSGSYYEAKEYVSSDGGINIYSFNQSPEEVNSDNYFAIIKNTDTYILFSEDETGTPFEFQSLSRIALTRVGTSNNRYFKVYESSNPSFSNATSHSVSFASGSSTCEVSLSSSSKYLKIVGESSFPFQIKQITIDYSCDNNFELDNPFEGNTYTLRYSSTTATLKFKAGRECATFKAGNDKVQSFIYFIDNSSEFHVDFAGIYDKNNFNYVTLTSSLVYEVADGIVTSISFTVTHKTYGDRTYTYTV